MRYCIENSYFTENGTATKLRGKISLNQEIDPSNNPELTIQEENNGITLLINGVKSNQDFILAKDGDSLIIDEESFVVQIGKIQLENDLLLIMLHQVSLDESLGAIFVMQIMKKIGDNKKKIEGIYKGFYRYLYSYDLKPQPLIIGLSDINDIISPGNTDNIGFSYTNVVRI